MKAPNLGRVAIGIVVILLVVGMFGNLADRFVLWPTTDPILGVEADRRALPAGEAWVIRSRAPTKRYVLRFYGNADRAERWIAGEARSFPDDVEAWGINYPGYGSSGGRATLQGVADAALAAYDAVHAIAPSAPVYVFGTSLGTTAALHVAAERKVAGVVLTNPPALREMILGDHGWWNLWLVAYPVALQIPRALDSVGNARRSTAPAVFVLSEADEVVPHRYHLMIRDAYAGPKETIARPGAMHNEPLDGRAQGLYTDAVARLFARTGG